MFKNNFKILLFFLLIALSVLPAGDSYAVSSRDIHRSEDDVLFYVIRLHQDIDNAASKKIVKGLGEAEEIGADYCVIDINTYGGAVDAADSIRSAIINTAMPVVAFINNQAVSAGALISIACDSIYMKRGGSFGAATVINANGEVMPDKFQSFMRATMRSTAESHGKKVVVRDGKSCEVWRRDPAIAERMVGSDSVLSFTPAEAIENGFCEGTAESLDEVIGFILKGNVTVGNGAEMAYVVVEQKISAIDKIIYFLMTPFLQGLLLMMIIGGLYFELQSPGIGFPLFAAITGAVLYFAPLYLEGLAQNWELILFIVGVLLLVAEVFLIPGFGVAGVSGIILIITGLSFAMIDNDMLVVEGSLNVRPLIKPFAIVLVSLTISIFGSILLASRLYGTRVFSRIALKTDLTANDGFVSVDASGLQYLVGKNATVATDLRPSGSVEIDGERYSAQSDYGFIGRGEKVTVKAVEGGVLICCK